MSSALLLYNSWMGKYTVSGWQVEIQTNKSFKLTADPLDPGIPSVPGFPCREKETKHVNA